MKNTLLEIIEAAIKNGLDPVAEIKDYLAEKDSRVTWHEASLLVERLHPDTVDTQAHCAIVS